MATSGRLGFTVRSLLNLPEQDAQPRVRSEPQTCVSQAAAWLESEHSHYPCESGLRWGTEGTRNVDPSPESGLEQTGGSVVLKPPGGASVHPESTALHPRLLWKMGCLVSGDS